MKKFYKMLGMSKVKMTFNLMRFLTSLVDCYIVINFE